MYKYVEPNERIVIEKIGSKYKLKCLVCGSNFLLRGGKFKEGGGKYCSRKCMWRSKTRANKLSKYLIGRRIAKDVSEEKNPQWKGDGAGYKAVHIWLNRHYQKKECYFCNKKNSLNKGGRSYLHWANISGEFQRKRDDYFVLCPSCHLILDRTIKLNQG
jgi:hypothetical protein